MLYCCYHYLTCYIVVVIIKHGILSLSLLNMLYYCCHY